MSGREILFGFSALALLSCVEPATPLRGLARTAQEALDKGDTTFATDTLLSAFQNGYFVMLWRQGAPGADEIDTIALAACRAVSAAAVNDAGHGDLPRALRRSEIAMRLLYLYSVLGEGGQQYGAALNAVASAARAVSRAVLERADSLWESGGKSEALDLLELTSLTFKFHIAHSELVEPLRPVQIRLSDAAFELGVVTWGMSRETLVALFGEPSDSEEVYEALGGTFGYILRFETDSGVESYLVVDGHVEFSLSP